jgi:2,3-bisphosphoglycerate-independent phosphoglycerate mutase
VLFAPSTQDLIEHGTVDPLDESMRTPLHYAKNADVARVLLDNGADVNAKSKDNETPLYKAQDVNIAKLLVEAKANLDARTSRGDTPLGAHSHYNDVHKYLRSIGAKE